MLSSNPKIPVPADTTNVGMQDVYSFFQLFFFVRCVGWDLHIGVLDNEPIYTVGILNTKALTMTGPCLRKHTYILMYKKRKK